jgi:putative spermidine/putrescine transport system permease protein
MPALHMLSLSLIAPENEGGGLTFAHYAKFFKDGYYAGIAQRTFRLSFLITTICLITGFPLALIIKRSPPWLRTGLILLVILPLMTSVVIRTFGWLVILGPGGMLSWVLQSLRIIDNQISLMHSEIGIVIAMVHVLLPFMVLSMLGSLKRIGSDLEEAGRVMGANFMRTIWHINLPLAMPGLVSGSLLVFALSISSFITPSLVGGVRLPMMAGSIYQQVTGSFDWGFAAALSVLLLGATLILIVPYMKIFRSKGY